MKIHKDCLVEKIASRDCTRLSIAESYLDIEDGVGQVITTNGHALACIPVELEEGDVAGHISAEGLKQARKVDKRATHASLHLNGNLKLDNGVEMPRSTLKGGHEFPNWRQVLPSNDGYTVSFALNAKLLYELAQSMGAEGVVLSFKADRAPILVRPTSLANNGHPACPEAKGVIMPLRIT
jgi:DNA polymerase III sliding clamp (beta) subunit (PCNA family)